MDLFGGRHNFLCGRKMGLDGSGKMCANVYLLLKSTKEKGGM